MTAQPKKKPSLIILKVFGFFLVLVLLAVLYLAVIVAQPQDGETDIPAATRQPLCQPAPAITASQENELEELIISFPVPVLSYLNGSGMTFVIGKSFDAAFENGYGRVLELQFSANDGTPVILSSIYPARAYDLMKSDGYHFDTVRGHVVCGTESVRMTNGQMTRLHLVNDQGIYSILIPAEAADRLGELIRSLQFFAVSVG